MAHLLHLKFSYNADIFPLCGPVITSCKHGPNQPTHTNTKYKFRAESCFPLSNFASSLTSRSATVNSSGADILANFTIFLNICELAKRPINESLGSLEIKNPKEKVRPPGALCSFPVGYTCLEHQKHDSWSEQAQFKWVSKELNITNVTEINLSPAIYEF